MKKIIAYYRVSTAKQGRSGLGLDAQRHAVHTHLGRAPDIEFIEVETGKRNDRPELQKALAHAELTGGQLVIAKLDRLSRNVAFLMTLKDSGVDFVAADMPHANRLTIGIMALVAQEEAEAISRRTKEALAAAKRNGVQLGGDRGNLARDGAKGREIALQVRSKASRDRAAKVMPIIAEAQAKGHCSHRQIASYLNGQGIRTPRGKAWQAAQVQRLLKAA